MIVFTPHALLKLRQRNLKREAVIQILGKPDHQMPGHSNRMIAFKKFGKLYLKVIFRKQGEDIVVITQHWVERIKS